MNREEIKEIISKLSETEQGDLLELHIAIKNELGKRAVRKMMKTAKEQKQ